MPSVQGYLRKTRAAVSAESRMSTLRTLRFITHTQVETASRITKKGKAKKPKFRYHNFPGLAAPRRRGTYGR